MKRPMLESKVEAHLVRRVNDLGGQVRKVQWIGRRGAPDRRVMLPWVCAWVELKRPGETLEAHQKREHKRMRRYGENVVTLDSIEAVDRWLEQSGRAA